MRVEDSKLSLEGLRSFYFLVYKYVVCKCVKKMYVSNNICTSLCMKGM